MRPQIWTAGMVNGYVRNCYLNLVYTVNDWYYRRRSKRGRRILWAAMGHSLDNLAYGITPSRIEANKIMFQKFLELGGFKR